MPWRDVNHPSSAEVKDRVQLYANPLWAFIACYRVYFTLIMSEKVKMLH